MSIGTVETRRPLSGGLAVRPGPRGAYGARLARMAVFGLFFVTLALSVCMVKWSIGPLPVRALVAMSLLLFVAAGILIVTLEKRDREMVLEIIDATEDDEASTSEAA